VASPPEPPRAGPASLADSRRSTSRSRDRSPASPAPMVARMGPVSPLDHLSNGRLPLVLDEERPPEHDDPPDRADVHGTDRYSGNLPEAPHRLHPAALSPRGRPRAGHPLAAP